MDLTSVIAAVVGCYIAGWCFGYTFLAWRRFFETMS